MDGTAAGTVAGTVAVAAGKAANIADTAVGTAVYMAARTAAGDNAAVVVVVAAAAAAAVYLAANADPFSQMPVQLRYPMGLGALQAIQQQWKPKRRSLWSSFCVWMTGDAYYLSKLRQYEGRCRGTLSSHCVRLAGRFRCLIPSHCDISKPTRYGPSEIDFRVWILRAHRKLLSLPLTHRRNLWCEM